MGQVQIPERLSEVLRSGIDMRSSMLPHTYFDELAEMGSLQEFLATYMNDEFKSNQRFRKQMLNLILDNMFEPNVEIERELLSDLQRALHHFLEKASTCTRTQL